MTKYWAIFKTQTINNIAYAGDLAVGGVTIVLFLWIFAQLWRVTYGAVGATQIAGMTLSDTLWYLMIAETIILSRPRLARLIAQQVRDGSVAYLLNKPYNFLLYQASVGMGDSVLRMGFNLLFGGAIVWVLAGPPPSPAGWPLVLVAMSLAWLIDFCISALIGLAAFVTEDVAAFEWIYGKILFILGGLLIPLDFYPQWLQTIAKSLPFAYTVYGPARLFVDPSLSRFGQLVLFQGVWLLVLGGLVTWAFNRGMRWLSINGG
ncbi:MAG: ABC-2 family transporter protein [Caldilineaceae bacterium]|nr:ABC-2 family transporter protein [Caldilineaceae bacterium]MBP8110346.1 ABC-2 family transporter protein [Caldilineaceae bacterium]MBP8124644.1 ABC-2 family transporter protein [Caldilineaceae bacterium]MBP9074971.1 ABC-2 family transporter protein [Caldilineaceae bacterium]